MLLTTSFPRLTVRYRLDTPIKPVLQLQSHRQQGYRAVLVPSSLLGQIKSTYYNSDTMNACGVCSHSSGGREAESQPGAAHHLSRRPYWFSGGPVAETEHLHGPSLQAVCEGRHRTRQPTTGPLLRGELSQVLLLVIHPLSSSFPLSSICPSIVYPCHPPFPASFDPFHPSHF